MAAAGAMLLSSGVTVVGVPTAVGGVLMLLQGGRRIAGLHKAAQATAAVASRHGEIDDMLARHVRPAEIARTLDEKYGVEPSRTLLLLAADRRRLLVTATADSERLAMMRWLASDQVEPLPAPAAELAALDPRATLYATVHNLHLRSDGAPDAFGSIFALRSHLCFLVDPAYEALGATLAREQVMNLLPTIVGAVNTAQEVVSSVRDVLSSFTPANIATLPPRLELPGSMALPWREIDRVWKASDEARASTIVELAVRHRGLAGTTEYRFSAEVSLDETWVEQMVDVSRSACALEGSFF